jgi:hypothetical protein
LDGLAVKMTTFCGRRDLFYTYWTGHTHDELAKNGTEMNKVRQQ